MQQSKLNIFISYSRKDTHVVDRLEVDLRVRNFDTWLDRLNLALQGGHHWKESLRLAIERANVVVLVVSPDAVESKYIRWEYLYALRLGKPVICLLYRPCPQGIPSPLQNAQWIDFQENRYSPGLSELIVSLMDIQLHPTSLPHHKPIFAADEQQPPLVAVPDLFQQRPSLTTTVGNVDRLWDEGMSAKANGNLDRALLLWQRLNEIEPNFRNGFLQSQLESLKQQVRQTHLVRLREIADKSQNESFWGREIAAWKALLAIEPYQREAQSRLQLAEKHAQHAWLYEKAQEALNKENIPVARQSLQTLWETLPSYGDPGGLAPQVGLPSPQTATQTSSGGYVNIPPNRGDIGPMMSSVRQQVAQTSGSVNLSDQNRYALYGCLGFILGSPFAGIGAFIGAGIGLWYAHKQINERNNS